MLPKPKYLCVILGLLISFGASAQQSDNKEPQLSTSELAIVDHKIATLKSSADRHVAEGWTNAKKVAELLCRPAALSVLQKQTSGVDRVFLGTDTPNTLHLESDRRLTGSGEFRNSKGWQDFTFTCELNPETGKVTGFQPVLSSTQP